MSQSMMGVPVLALNPRLQQIDDYFKITLYSGLTATVLSRVAFLNSRME